jgi:hypothetical protein
LEGARLTPRVRARQQALRSIPRLAEEQRRRLSGAREAHVKAEVVGGISKLPQHPVDARLGPSLSRSRDADTRGDPPRTEISFNGYVTDGVGYPHRAVQLAGLDEPPDRRVKPRLGGRFAWTDWRHLSAEVLSEAEEYSLEMTEGEGTP